MREPLGNPVRAPLTVVPEVKLTGAPRLTSWAFEKSADREYLTINCVEEPKAVTVAEKSISVSTVLSRATEILDI